GLIAHGPRDVYALPSPQDLADTIPTLATEGDYVICLGAGSISAMANALPTELESLTQNKTSKRA
ncbi:MAG: UDP-N-acetylmuramate--L-alanine ligase, partial [Bdellovibrionales bacterium]